MDISFSFSCDPIEIDVSVFPLDKYSLSVSDIGTLKVKRVSYDSLVCKLSNAPRIINEFTYHFTKVLIDDSHNAIIIPKQLCGRFRSSDHPSKEDLIFPHINNMAISNIDITDYDIDHTSETFHDEKEMVLNLLLGRCQNPIQPFTSKWIEFYDKHKELAKDYMEKHNKQAEDFMATLIDGDVRFIKVGEVNTNATI